LEIAAQRGTGTRAVLDDRPIAGKTGTHQGFREAWFIGFIPQYTSSVWIGFAEEQLPLTNVEINGEIISNVSGGRVPAPMWKEFMVKVVENLPVVEWPADPSDLEKYYEIPTVEIPQLIGLNVLDAEEIAFSSYLLPKIILTESDEVPGLVLTQNIEAGTEVPEGTELVVEVSGKTFSAPIPNLPPCTYTADEAEELLKEFMRDSNVILFILRNYESTDVQGCEGKVIGTNVAQGATVSTGDTIILIIKGNISP
jgi:membrane peptidoglycan carboxypeptidase